MGMQLWDRDRMLSFGVKYLSFDVKVDLRFDSWVVRPGQMWSLEGGPQAIGEYAP